jgi:hypothetical protein
MKTYKTQFLTILAALIAAAITTQAQYIFTTLDDPGTNSSGPDSILTSFSGTNIVGGYGSWFGGGVLYGLVLSGTNWISLTNPSAGTAANQGTYAGAMSGSNIVGWYYDSGGVQHGFLYDGSTWTTLDDPKAELSPSGGTDAGGIDGTNISGFYTDASGVTHGFLYNTVTKTWTPLNDPLAGSSSGQGTYAGRISGTNIVGSYYSASGGAHGFLYDISASTWTTLNAPGAGGGGTQAYNISGTNIVGVYWGANGVYHGFLHSGTNWTTNWTTVDDRLGGSGSGQGTYALGIEGDTVVGIYIDGNGIYHGFLATPRPQLATTLSSNALTISWPYWNNALTGWSLQQNPDLTTTNWKPSGGTVSNDGTNNYYLITPSPGNLFFRLSQQ